MPERLHPGVYIEERRGGPAPIAGVSTSNYGVCGFTKQGPVDEAVLVTSFEQFQEIFGGFTPDGLVPTDLFAFFSMGGQRAYVVRVIASDAALALTTIKLVEPAGTTLWTVNAKTKGAWGNRLKIELRGSPDYYVTATASYSRYDFLVYLQNEDTLAYELKETFAAVSLEVAADADYFPDVVNDPDTGSDLVVIVEPGVSTYVPTALKGTSYTAENVGTGDAIETEFTDTLTNFPVGKKSVVIHWTTIADAAKLITDDGMGNLIGDVDPTGTNTIDYETGDIDFKCSSAPKDLSALTCDYAKMPTETSYAKTFTTGSDGTAAIGRDEISNPSLKAANRGVYALGRTEEMMAVGTPDFPGNTTIYSDLITEAELRKDWYLPLTTPQGYTPQQAKDFRQLILAANTKYASLYYPWIKITDPITNRGTYIPPCGHIAGAFARTDVNKNVGKNPAGMEDGKLLFCTGLERMLSLGEIDILNPVGVNCLYESAETGRVIWGCRTLEIGGEFTYVNHTRLFQFVEKSVFRATHWVVFENNSPSLQTSVKLQITSFLRTLYQSGYFAGTTPSEAFFVICDATNNIPETVNLGLLYCDIGMAPNKPAEFVVFRFQQKTMTSE